MTSAGPFGPIDASKRPCPPGWSKRRAARETGRFSPGCELSGPVRLSRLVSRLQIFPSSARARYSWSTAEDDGFGVPLEEGADDVVVPRRRQHLPEAELLADDAVNGLAMLGRGTRTSRRCRLSNRPIGR
jgi:hypothetical protein